jgi:hypothetical protein
VAEIAIPFELETPEGVLAFNPAAGANGFYLMEVSGLDGAAVRASAVDRPQSDGAILFDSFWGALTPVLGGYVKCAQPGDSEATAIAARRDLIDDFLAHCHALLRADGILRYTPSGESERRLEAVRLFERPDISGGLTKQFQLALVTGDPIAYSEAVLDEQRTNTGSVSCVNGGNVPTKPVIRVEGPWTSSSPIVVTNTTTGLAWTVEGTAGSDGQYVEADHKQETLKNQAGSSYLRYLDPSDSEFFALEPGTNSISLAGSGMTSSTTFTVTWRDGWAPG